MLDFATSVVAEGKVLVASQGGKKLPDDALIGPDGKPSADPHLLYGDYTPTGPRDHGKGTGAIRAFGDHKGSGLAFMCELLGGSLIGHRAPPIAGGGRFAQRHAVLLRRSRRCSIPRASSPRDVAALRRLREERQAGRRRAARCSSRASPRHRMRHQRLAEGVPLPDDTWAAIVDTARAVGARRAPYPAGDNVADTTVRQVAR